MVHGGDLSGATVHAGARLVGLARPSEVLVSSTVQQLLAGSRLQLAARGAPRLKGFPGRWLVYSVQGETEPPPAWTAGDEPHKRVRVGDKIILEVATRAPWLVRSVARLASGSGPLDTSTAAKTGVAV